MTDTSSEQHRSECEAREVASWPQAKRVEFYANVEEHRGAKAAARLVEDVGRVLREMP